MSPTSTSASAAPPPPRPSVAPTTTPTVTATRDAGSLEALQEVLAGEHAVIWAYGTLGPRLDEAGEERARTLLAAHQRTQQAVRAQLIGAGAEPVAAEPAYELPIPPVDPASAIELAGLVEERLAAVYADLVGAATAPDLRLQGVSGVVDCTLRAASWRPTDTGFPGLPERAGQ